MTEIKSRIPIHQLAFLQAYLYEIFSTEKKCEKDFRHTEWFLRENFPQDKIENIIEFFSQEGLSCDCDIIKKLDLRELSDNKFIFHE
ncbi:MAG: DUF2695 domain-containing protein [Candidatus Doudnabacteria bacterium]